MPILMTQRSISILIVAFLMSLMLASCAKEQDSPAIKQHVRDRPCATVERRNKAMEDSYEINRGMTA